MKPETAGSVAVPRSILVYSHSWLPGQVDGVAVRIMAHVRALAERGTEVTVVTPDFVIQGEEPSERKALVAIPGVEHVVIQTQKTPVYRKNLCMALTIANLWTLVDLILRKKPDLVHGTQEASMQVLATACLLCNVPLVISLHTDVAQIAAADPGFSTLGGLVGRLHARIAVLFVHWGYRNWALAGAGFFPVSRHAISILRTAGVAETRVLPGTWGPMVDQHTFRIDLPEEDVAAARERLSFGIAGAYLLVYVGRVTAEKDVQFLVDALDRAPAHVVLALVGVVVMLLQKVQLLCQELPDPDALTSMSIGMREGGFSSLMLPWTTLLRDAKTSRSAICDRGRIEAGSLAAELSKLHGREHRLYCTGEFVGREQVARATRAADCCVSASTMETIGFTAMEALSCGTPMLAARAQGFAEHLTHGVNARLFAPGDPASFDCELAAMMASPREEPWTREALRASIEVASVDACTDRCLRAYEAAGPADRWPLRVILTIIMFYLNWFFSWFIH